MQTETTFVYLQLENDTNFYLEHLINKFNFRFVSLVDDAQTNEPDQQNSSPS